MSNQRPKDFDSVESRRSKASQRRMTPARRIYYFLGLPVQRALIRLLASTYRVEVVIGAERIEPFIKDDTVCAPCYWRQHQVVGSMLIRSWLKRGFKACFLVSGSVDGEVPERVARAWGAEVIRGSANAPLDQLEPHRRAVQESVMSLMRQSEQVLEEVRV